MATPQNKKKKPSPSSFKNPSLFPFEASSLIEELGKLVGQNFIAFDPITGEYTLQGKSVEKGLHLFIQSLEKDS